MPAYLDAGFLLTTLIPSTGGSQKASHLLRSVGAPFLLHFLHQLQVENLFVNLQTSPDPGRQRVGSDGFKLWRNYLAEGVFRLAPADWDGAFRLAIAWNGQYATAPPPFLLMLHQALAVAAGATAFLSFDPRARAVARRAGLQVLPEKSS